MGYYNVVEYSGTRKYDRIDLFLASNEKSISNISKVKTKFDVFDAKVERHLSLFLYICLGEMLQQRVCVTRRCLYVAFQCLS